MMRLAVSNIAWPAQDAQRAYEVLAEAGVQGLEVAPGLLFSDAPDAFDPAPGLVRAIRAQLAAARLTLCSMQSLLFGVQGAALFGTADERTAFERGLKRAIRLAGRLDIRNLVVGSPRNRVVPSDMAQDEAEAQAAEVFRRLGDEATAHRCVLAMEPNPAAYGTNFLNTLAEVDAFVRRVAHPAVTVNFDLGAVHVNEEFGALRALLDLSLPRVSHVHLSEPGLAPFPRDEATAEEVFRTLRGAGWNGWVSVEMVADRADPIGTLRRSLAMTVAAMGSA